MDKSLSKYSIKLQNHANRKSKAWAFFGMVLLTENNKSIEEDKVFCKLCFEEQKKDDETMIFSCAKIQSYSKNCSTGNLMRHLNNVHNLRDIDTEGTILKCFNTSRPVRSPQYLFDTILAKEEPFDSDEDLPLDSIVDTILTKEEAIDYDDDLPMSSYSGASKSSFAKEEAEDPIKSSTESPEPKRRKSDNTSQLTPFEVAMLDIERDRTDKLEHIAKCRLEVMKRMAAENVEFHKKVLAVMKSKK